MAFIRTEDYTTNDGKVYANVGDWIAENGRTCIDGETVWNYTVSHALLDGGNGIQVKLTYVDEAAHTAHMDSIKADFPDVDLTGSWAHSDNITCTFVSVE